MPSRNILFGILLWVGIVTGQPVPGVFAQDESLPPGLVELREGLTRAYNTGDLELLLSYCHDDVIAVWQNGQVAVGHQGVRDVVKELTREGGIIAGYTADPTVDHRMFLDDGNTVVSIGQMNDVYTLAQPAGTEVRLNSQWTAAIAKIDDRWQILNFHVSTNAFDNEVITLYSNMNRWVTSAVAGAIGLVLGLVAGILVFRRRKRTDAPVPEGVGE